MSKIERYVYARAVTDEQVQNRQAEFVISTEAIDTYGTVFTIDGWMLERYANNPVVLYAHKMNSDDPDLVIGTSEVRVEGNELIAIVTFEDGENNPLAEKVFKKVQAGILRMASISADCHEGHWGDFEKGQNPDVFYFTRQELLEWSIVPVGSNPEALKRSADNLEEIKKRFPKEGSQLNNNSVAMRIALVDLKIKMYK